MTQVLYRNFWILAILAFALLVRLPGVLYGLPLHLFGDEEVNIYSALQMIKLHRLLPVLHPADFQILYEPPLLSYVYVVFFVPLLAVMYVLQGMPGLGHFANTVIVDPSAFWILGRLINIAISLSSVYLVYRIGLYLFKEKTPALIAALLVAASFIDATLAATTRQWALSTCLSLLSLFLALAYIHASRHGHLLIYAAGAAMGLSFGAGYLVYYLPFIGLLILYDAWQRKQTFNLSLLTGAFQFSIAFALVAVAMIAVAPQPFFQQVLDHVETHEHTLFAFIIFYARALWEYETPLLFGTLVGIFALWQTRRDLLAFFGIFLAITLAIMYVFLWNLERYLEPLIPLLALVGGYGVATVCNYFSNKKVLTYVLVGVFALYTLAVFGRYSYLMYLGDTRLEAQAWVRHTLPAGSTLLVDADNMRFTPTEASLGLLEQNMPQVLRGPDEALLNEPSLTLNPAFNSFNLYLVQGEAQQKLLNLALTHATSSVYLISDAWRGVPPSLREHATLLNTFSPGELPPLRGLFVGGEEHRAGSAHVLQLLWNSNYFGPEVNIYKIKIDN